MTSSYRIKYRQTKEKYKNNLFCCLTRFCCLYPRLYNTMSERARHFLIIYGWDCTGLWPAKCILIAIVRLFTNGKYLAGLQQQNNTAVKRHAHAPVDENGGKMNAKIIGVRKEKYYRP